jgi:phosphoglycerate dehydrogenase-like enzyme
MNDAASTEASNRIARRDLRVAVLDDYQRVALEYGDWERLGPDRDVTVFDRNLDLEEAKVALAPYEVLCLMRERMALPRGLIEALPNLRLVIFTGVRTRSIDFAALAERGIIACHTGGGEMQPATAELTWGLILSAMRHLPREMAGMRDGGWQTTVGTVLEGRTLGLLGLGKLGQRVAAIGAAFGMQRIAWSPNLTAERAEAAGVTLVDKDRLFATSDAQPSDSASRRRVRTRPDEAGGAPREYVAWSLDRRECADRDSARRSDPWCGARRVRSGALAC